MSGHWTDDQVIAHLYGIGPEDGHLERCAECQERANGMLLSRRAVERAEDEVSFEFLAAQRRQIYQKLSKPARWTVRRWASAAAAVLVLVGGLTVYQEQHQQRLTAVQVSDNKISDTQLAADVAKMAQGDSDASAPIQELFEE